ncbi:hypothetical protein JSO19_05510 [Leucobacter sp. UCMA 4100]|uniref:ABC transporter substrate-binding protein n=1 Tax=Leucobacter sp. UCMA 4100 TaxID=2810534 RepID=UPI0022EA31E0|nr:ABC transporter substrate-binding protein [Leucobacter sp. UCMA 4100]MDA3146831.1 hypothetical protein [Leucobacter sp. UCMA 4100]
MRKPAIGLISIGAIALALTACSPSAGESGNAEERVMTIAMNAQPPNLDPHVSTATATASISRNILETLLTTDGDRNVVPMLAESYETNADGTVYTFTLRSGVTFHDGSALDAEDVVASMERWDRLSGPGQSTFADAEWAATDDLTVTLTLPAPSFTVPIALSSGREQFAGIYPSEVVEAAGDDAIEDVIGTGPFMLDEWVPDQKLVLNKFDDYSPTEGPIDGLSGDRTAQTAGLKYVFVADASTRILGLQTGEYDAVPEIPYDNAADVLDDPALRAGSTPGTLLNLYYNKAEGLFSNVKARQAVDTLLDRESIMKAAVVDDEFFALTPHMMMADQEGQWKSSVGADSYNPNDPEKAKKLLEEAGYQGETIKMIVTRDYSEAYNAAVVIQEELQSIGATVSLDTYDWPTFSEIRNDPSAYDLTVIPNTPKNDPGSLVFMRNDFAGFTESPELDALLQTFRNSATLEEAQSHYDELQQWFIDYIPVSKIGDAYGVHATTLEVEQLPVDDSIIWWAARFTE